jgi:flavodoxin
MKTAIIYTSKHGTTAKVAHLIAERLTGNQVSIIDLKIIKRITKTDKSVSQIREENIEKFVKEINNLKI